MVANTDLPWGPEAHDLEERHLASGSRWTPVIAAPILSPMNTVVVIDEDRMGGPDAELGARILKTFLQKARALRGLEAILLFNGGVKLVAADSHVRAELTLLEENGVDIVPCGTCLTHFGVDPAVGKVSSMDDILTAMDRADKVITL